MCPDRAERLCIHFRHKLQMYNLLNLLTTQKYTQISAQTMSRSAACCNIGFDFYFLFITFCYSSVWHINSATHKRFNIRYVLLHGITSQIQRQGNRG